MLVLPHPTGVLIAPAKPGHPVGPGLGLHALLQHWLAVTPSRRTGGSAEIVPRLLVSSLPGLSCRPGFVLPLLWSLTLPVQHPAEGQRQRRVPHQPDHEERALSDPGHVVLPHEE